MTEKKQGQQQRRDVALSEGCLPCLKSETLRLRSGQAAGTRFLGGADQQQIPFGNDRKKCKGKENSKGKDKDKSNSKGKGKSNSNCGVHTDVGL
jgi:hypothetical protein